MSNGSRLAISLTMALLGMACLGADLRAATFVKVTVNNPDNTTATAADFTFHADFIDGTTTHADNYSIALWPLTINIVTPSPTNPRLNLKVTRISTGEVVIIPSLNTNRSHTLYLTMAAPMAIMMRNEHEHLCHTADHSEVGGNFSGPNILMGLHQECQPVVVGQPACATYCHATLYADCATHSCRKCSRRSRCR